jgi:hypothetical protein
LSRRGGVLHQQWSHSHWIHSLSLLGQQCFRMLRSRSRLIWLNVRLIVSTLQSLNIQSQLLISVRKCPLYCDQWTNLQWYVPIAHSLMFFYCESCLCVLTFSRLAIVSAVKSFMHSERIVTRLCIRLDCCRVRSYQMATKYDLSAFRFISLRLLNFFLAFFGFRF